MGIVAPEITPAHLRIAENCAVGVSRTVRGHHAGLDELISQSLVDLWDLALAYDASLGVPFTAYLAKHLKLRLIDWLRHEYGRDETTIRQQATLSTVSLDELPWDDFDCSKDRALISSAPGVEQTVMAREDLREVAQDLEQLDSLARDAMLWPVTGETLVQIQRRYGLPKRVVPDTRYATKRELQRRRAQRSGVLEPV